MMLIYPRLGEAMDCAKNGKFGKRGASKGQHCATVAYGHLAAVKRMVEQEQYCVDILKQISGLCRLLYQRVPTRYQTRT